MYGIFGQYIIVFYFIQSLLTFIIAITNYVYSLNMVHILLLYSQRIFDFLSVQINI